MCGHVKGWQPSGNLGQNRGCDESRGARVFFVVNQTTFPQLRNSRFPTNLVTKRISVSRCRIQKDTLKNFHFRGYLPPKSEIERRSNRDVTQSRLQVTGCTAEILFTPRYSPRVRELPRSGQLFSTTYGCWATGRQSFPIYGFLPIFTIQNP